MEMLQTLGVNWGMLIAQMINFGVLLAVLTFLLYKPVLKVIDERRERVRQSMDHAAKLEQQVAAMEKDRKKQMQELDEKMKQLLAESRTQGESLKKGIVDAAQADVSAMLEKGRKQLEDEKRKLLADLQKTVTTVSVQLAEKILQREFSETDQKRVLSSLEKDIPSLVQ